MASQYLKDREYFPNAPRWGQHSTENIAFCVETVWTDAGLRAHAKVSETNSGETKMHWKQLFSVAMATGMMAAGPAWSETKIYRYHTHENYCPDGLQPISISGVICCGVPNQAISYQQAKGTPRGHATHRRSVAKADDCPAGVKGCSSN